MIEAGVLVVDGKPVYWHVPEGRTGGSIPDSRKLWDMLWLHRKADSLGFAHSHPSAGVPGPSRTDVTTFEAVERGLGLRLIWWITSSDHVILMSYGGEKFSYPQITLEYEPSWVRTLRRLSQPLLPMPM